MSHPPQYGPPWPQTATDPLAAPMPGAGFGQAFSRFWRKYATFSGRASRSEYWWAVLAHVLIVAAFYTAILVLATGTAATRSTGSIATPVFLFLSFGLFAYWVATILPGIALAWRRLHDANLPGPWFFIAWVPFGGSIALLVLLVLPSSPAGARFDPGAVPYPWAPTGYGPIPYGPPPVAGYGPPPVAGYAPPPAPAYGPPPASGYATPPAPAYGPPPAAGYATPPTPAYGQPSAGGYGPAAHTPPPPGWPAGQNAPNAPAPDHGAASAPDEG